MNDSAVSPAQTATEGAAAVAVSDALLRPRVEPNVFHFSRFFPRAILYAVMKKAFAPFRARKGNKSTASA